MGDDPFWVLPGLANPARDDGAAEENLDLMEIALWIVKFIHQAGLSNVYGQPSLFQHLTGKVLRQAGMVFCTPTWHAPKPRVAFPSVDDQKTIILKNNSAGSNPGHGRTIRILSPKRKFMTP